MEMTRAFVPLLVASNRNRIQGSDPARIVMIGSLAAFAPTPFYSAYNSSKAALFQYANTLRIELEPFDVKVITVSLRDFPSLGLLRKTNGFQTNTGLVESRIVRQANRTSLPEGSLYAPIKDVFDGHGHEVFTSTRILLYFNFWCSPLSSLQ